MDTQAEPGQDQDQHAGGELHLPPLNPTGAQPKVPPTPTQPEASVSPPGANQTAGESQPNVFYLREDDLPEDHDAAAFDTVFATPFQWSEAIPPIGTGKRQQPTMPASAPVSRPTRRSFPLVRLLMLAAVIVIAMLAVAMATAAQSSPTFPAPRPAPGASSTKQQTTTGSAPLPAGKPTPTPVPRSGTRSGQNGLGTWLALPLPAGWTDAGLAGGDALEASRTAVAFTDREMSLDYRSVGTRAHHAGTLTAATFVLTRNAQVRFATNDVRVINNVLFDRVQQEKLIQSVINPQPQLAKFEAQGNQQFAWVDVSFQLWQSKLDASGKRTEGFESDPATNQALLHHMTVLLLRVPHDAQGAMGGTGWLVSDYALDLPIGSTLDIVQPA